MDQHQSQMLSLLQSRVQKQQDKVEQTPTARAVHAQKAAARAAARELDQQENPYLRVTRSLTAQDVADKRETRQASKKQRTTVLPPGASRSDVAPLRDSTHRVNSAAAMEQQQQQQHQGLQCM